MVNAEPNAAEVLPSDKRKWRPTSDFPADPPDLSREMLETHYRAMRASHIFLARARGQRKRHSEQWNRQRSELFNILHSYQEKIALLGGEKVEAMQLAKDFQRELEAFERKDQALSQLLNEFESSSEKTGFWDILKITQLLQRMRQLLRGSEPRPGQDNE